ncbi:MAG: ABC transporter permease [Clostridia bacterium]|nr:ABC transporter permease [Clostridia bacterium]
MEALLETIAGLLAPGGELWQIIGVTLRMSVLSTLIAFALGGSLGVLVGMNDFRGKRLILHITSTLMGLPPVLAGLVVFFLLSRSGPLGTLRLLYSVTAMVTAQVLLITPIVLNMTATAVGEKAPAVMETLGGLGLPRRRRVLLMLGEIRSELFAVLFLGFGRAVSEVGAAQIVGGNVQYKTRVMTTAIVLETNKGNFGLALALGALLLIIAFAVNLLGRMLGGRRA